MRNFGVTTRATAKSQSRGSQEQSLYVPEKDYVLWEFDTIMAICQAAVVIFGTAVALLAGGFLLLFVHA